MIIFSIILTLLHYYNSDKILVIAVVTLVFFFSVELFFYNAHYLQYKYLMVVKLNMARENRIE